ncbi:MAG: glycosyltransferase, partial [Candidatus Moranbacteria bacterium]|nr:glycosyltransferase [Candidatus Moranbacteria bacterium]
MMNYPKVFIVILNHNSKATVQKCLTSVFKLNYPNFEVVFVDNDSNDGSLELAKTNFSKANFIKNAENLGCAAGNNIGIR